MRGVTEHPLAVFADGRGSLLKAHPGRVEGEVYAIVVTPGASRGHHLHRLTTEVFVAVSGEGVVTRDDEEIHISPGQAVDLPQGCWHRVRNDGTEPFVFIEVQRGSYFGEDDTERREDDYGRA